MIRSTLMATLLVGAAPPVAAPSVPVTRINATPARDGWFVCDAVSGPTAAFVGKADANGRSLITLLDRRSGRFDTQAYQVGPGDAGAGQLHWPLSQKGQEVGNVHGINPGMINGAILPPIMGLAIGPLSLDCRFLTHLRFVGLDSRRSFAVTEEDGDLVYQTFDFAKRGAATQGANAETSNAPTLRVTGGQETADGFRFGHDGYEYVIARHGTAPATVTVNRRGQLVQVERLVGYSWAPHPTIGPEAVWDGTGLDACRQQARAASLDSCLLATMARNGASDASIDFTRTLIAKNDSGYIAGWKQAGPVGIAALTFPFRANTNSGTALIPASGDPIMVDAYEATAADKARADWRAWVKRHPQAFPIAPGDVAMPKLAAGTPFTIRVRTPTADCHACAPTGAMTVAYRFDAAGRLLGSAVERVD